MNKKLVLNDKYIIQNPYSSNCLIVALANLFIHDGTMTTEQGFRLVDNMTRKFDVNTHGAQALLIGETIYKFGYDQMMIMAPGDVDAMKFAHDDGWLGIRCFTTCIGQGARDYQNFLVNKSEYYDFNSWRLAFADKHPRKFEVEKPVRANSLGAIGCHAVFYYNFKEDGENTTADCVNVTNVISSCYWCNMGTINQLPHLLSLRAIGSQLCIMARKRKVQVPVR